MSQAAKPAHQFRSRKTRDKLLNALENLLHKHDFGDIGVSDIAKEAGVSPASIYRRFDSKDGFIPVLFELYLARLSDVTQSDGAQLDIEGLDLRTVLVALAKVGITQIKSQAHILRAIMLHGLRRAGLIEEYTEQYVEMTLHSMQGILAHFQADIHRKDIDTAARMLAYYFNNILITRIIYAGYTPDFGLVLSDDEFAEEIADFAYGYLTCGQSNKAD
ncbi:TetR/AcrR family transcriptional regulator [Kordiimonas aquimaris]|uniref:TetR/AcrR family transcriptional regulator n=1 Tax=Kordiimonas aquimaris TaxID=707591 RepID=UPI0021D35366|nr:TetR/AcrR family transcriptional regulator [Kordiimonas aquimaris]